MSCILRYIVPALFVLVVGGAGGTVQAQSTPAQPGPADTSSLFRLTRTIGPDIVDFNVDNLGNIYVLNKDNRLKKLSSQGDSLAVFNDVRRYGQIASIVAYDNNIWVFDELDAILKRVGDDGSLVDQTSDFRQLFDSIPDPAIIRDQGGLVYLYDPAKGVYIFDHYGTLKTHLDLRGWRDFDVIDKNMLGRDDHQFFRYQPGTLNMQEEPIPAAYAGAVRIHITPSIIYVLKSTGLEIYSRK